MMLNGTEFCCDDMYSMGGPLYFDLQPVGCERTIAIWLQLKKCIFVDLKKKAPVAKL